MQVHLRVSFSQRQVKVDVHRLQNDVCGSQYLYCRYRLAVVTSRRTSLRAVAEAIEVSC